jgi:hypothetical protein
MSTQNIAETLRLVNLIDKKGGEPLADFLLNLEKDKLMAARQQNLDLLFAEARKYRVRFIFIGKAEICGCEDKDDIGGTWPAMWAIAKTLGFRGSCGNSDQYQCHNADKVFPAEAYGAWDLKLKKKLTKEEIVKKKFGFVVTEPNEYA